MKIEHFAFQVEETLAVTNWYCKNFGFTVKRGGDNPFPVRFLADETGQVMIEIYSNPSVETPNYKAMDPLLLHMAFVCKEIPATISKLVSDGASVVSGPDTSPNGDQLAMLRDPWGLAIQLCHRSTAMV